MPVKRNLAKKPSRKSTTPASKKKGFDPSNLWSSVIAIPMQEKISAPGGLTRRFAVIIDLNLDCRGGRELAKEKVRKIIVEKLEQPYNAVKNSVSEQYVFAELSGADIRKLVELDQSEMMPPPKESKATPVTPGIGKDAPKQSKYVRVIAARAGNRVPRAECAIYRVWPDFEIKLRISKSISTVKADAAHKSFSALGNGIVWAVMDSGVERHAHFEKYGNLDLMPPLEHRDFSDPGGSANVDQKGHGTHVAGIIAGYLETTNGKDGAIAASMTQQMGEGGGSDPQLTFESVPVMSGMAPQCKIVSLRVLNDLGKGNVSNLIAAINYIQELNGYGRRLMIHGVNISIGYDFDPEWFACGQSPLCVEVNRLVRSGVVVVVAAGNSGYILKGAEDDSFASGETLTINDPGNAEMAITVGSTHRDMPHTYGVSYFSSKGPTGDGRLKPDLLAPGEKILSCAARSTVPPAAQSKKFVAAAKKTHENANLHWYVADSGTSMAAPHVSGAIAAFLSIRREFISRPEEVKKIFLASATDLGRERYFQGNGLIDLMRAIQAI